MARHLTDLGTAIETTERANPETKGQRGPNGKTQKECVVECLELFGPELAVEDLADLASKDYGRRIPPGNAMSLKHQWKIDTFGEDWDSEMVVGVNRQEGTFQITPNGFQVGDTVKITCAAAEGRFGEILELNVNTNNVRRHLVKVYCWAHEDPKNFQLNELAIKPKDMVKATPNPKWIRK